MSLNLPCLFTTVVPALLVQLHNVKTSLREKKLLLQDGGSDYESLCNIVFMAGHHSKNERYILKKTPTSPLCYHSTVSKAPVISSALLAKGLILYVFYIV